MCPRYEPPSSLVGAIEFRPFMLEVAWDYCRTALCSTHQRGLITQTLGALAVEIVLKSFNANVSGNFGELTETYQFNSSILPPKSDGHNLNVLADALRHDVRAYLLNHFDNETLVEHQNTFTDSRYHYERKSPTWSSGEVMKLAVKLICTAVFLYQQQGCSDPFIRNFDVNTTYFKYVQPILGVPSCEA